MEEFMKVSQKDLEKIAGMPVATQNYLRCTDPDKLPPSFKLGKRIYYNKPDVLAWIESCRMGRAI